MTAQPLLLDAPSAAPDLAQARALLDRLQAQHDAILREAEDCGADGELETCLEWKKLCRELATASARVRLLETEALR